MSRSGSTALDSRKESAALSHPSWFPTWAAMDDGWHIAVLGAIALTAGNVWYVVHRYTIHQIIDYIVYAITHRDLSGYVDWLGNHIDGSFHVPNTEEKLRNHVHFRSAQIIFLFIIAEALMIFSANPEDHTLLVQHRCLPMLCGIGLFLWCAFVQYGIGHSLDVMVANRYRQKPSS